MVGRNKSDWSIFSGWLTGQYIRGYSLHREDIMSTSGENLSTSGDMLSTSRDVQCSREYHDSNEGI